LTDLKSDRQAGGQADGPTGSKFARGTDVDDIVCRQALGYEYVIKQCGKT